MKNNKLQKDNIDKKIQQRIDVGNKVLNKVVIGTDTNKKEVLQNKSNVSLDERFSIDYRKERAMLKTSVLDNLRNKMNHNDNNNRSDVNDYYEMNNKLIKENIYPKIPTEKLKN